MKVNSGTTPIYGFWLMTTHLSDEIQQVTNTLFGTGKMPISQESLLMINFQQNERITCMPESMIKQPPLVLTCPH
jgi:hypothetical protein